MLRQIAVRLNGVYHNGNEKHLSTTTLNELTAVHGRTKVDQWTQREFALLACAFGAGVWALLPLALHYAGTRWRPGVPLTTKSQTPPVGGRPGGGSKRTNLPEEVPTRGRQQV